MPKSSSSEIAYSAVKDRILDGELPGGDLVSEGQIATELEMSRTPVREAFLRLEAEGLMRLYPKRGALVVPVAEGEMMDVVRARHLVEVDAVEMIGRAPGADAGLREALDAAIAAQETALSNEDTPGFAIADADFHRAVVTAGGNAVLGQFYGSLRDRQRRMTSRAARRSPERMAAIVVEHRRLAELACAGDAAAYATELWHHISLTHSLPDSTIPGARR